MRVLVTGVGGFLGRRLASLLAASGHRVFGTYLETDSPLSLDEVELIPADLLSVASLEAAVERADPEAIVHFAGLSHVGDSWRHAGEYFQVNVIGTENLLDLVKDRFLILASSAEVYGRVPESEQPISESRAVGPRNPYGLTKAAAERLVLRSGATVVRMFNVVGPGQAPSFALPSFARQLAAVRDGQQATLKTGNLTARRDFIHIDDAVVAYQNLLEHNHLGGVYNLGSGQAVSMGEALDLLREVSGVDCPIEQDPERLRPVDVALYQADISRIIQTGWQPVRTLRDALLDLWTEAGSTTAATA